MEQIAMVCNCVIFYYDFITFTSGMQNIIFNLLFFITDVNECNNVTYPCHANATCKNTNGYYICDCRKGFDGDGTNCTGMYLISINSPSTKEGEGANKMSSVCVVPFIRPFVCYHDMSTILAVK